MIENKMTNIRIGDTILNNKTNESKVIENIGHFDIRNKYQLVFFTDKGTVTETDLENDYTILKED